MSRASDDEAGRLPVQLDEQTLAGMEISTWRTEAGDFDVLVDLPDSTGRRRSFDELAGRARSLDVDRIAVRVAALDDVIASKEWANRPKDHEALPELRAIRDRSTPGNPTRLEHERQRNRRDRGLER